jgi:hypothetical protein
VPYFLSFVNFGLAPVADFWETEIHQTRTSPMRIKGITYDTGFINAGVSTKETFEPTLVQREMQIIKQDLHCNAVRITGGDINRLEQVAELAAAEGLQVWYCPFTCDLTTDELLAFLVESAQRAERIRSQGAEVVFLTGSEISLFTKGFFQGETLTDRLKLIKDPTNLREQIPQVRNRMKDFLSRVVPQVREKFFGPISYASIPFEGIDWQLFDFIATDGGYRSAAIAPYFQQGIRTLVSQGKPVAITEFGCGTYRGAAEQGARADWIIEWVDGKAHHLNGIYIRDEDEQASCILELLELFETENVDAVFVNTFARYDLPHGEEPRLDLDLASGGVVKVYADRLGDTYPTMPWEPKKVFKAIADVYRNSETE